MKRIAIVANTSRARAGKAAASAITMLVQKGIEVIVDEATAVHVGKPCADDCRVVPHAEFEKFADAVITFGGDGTLLSIARLLVHADVPIMGVNVGRLGFLAEFSSDEVPKAIECLLSGSYRVVDRSTLEVEAGSLTSVAVNEILVERSTFAKMISVRAHVDDHHVADYSSDGVIVATPTGSTAYSLAAGGPIIAPSAEAFCITPIAPHTLTLRPLIINDNSIVRLELMNDQAVGRLVADGVVLGTIRHDDHVIIRKGAHSIKLIKRVDSTYYDLLREKLLWSADPSRTT